MALPTRIDDRIDRQPAGCWLWTGGASRGYGVVRWNGPVRKVHRVVYEALRGPVADGLVLDHLCRNTRCCNPDHLEAVAHRANIARGDHYWRKQTHCVHGHEFTPDNTYLRRNRRYCRACLSARSRARYAAQRAGA